MCIRDRFKMASTEKMRTKKVRVWYEHLLVQRKNDKGDDAGYDCMLLIPKTDTDVIDKIKELSEGLAKQVFGKGWKMCIRDRAMRKVKKIILRFL